MSVNLVTSHKIGRVVYDAKTGEYVAKRTFTCRAMYEFQGLRLKCQLHGRHKGIHLHGLARPGAVVTITWHPMVTVSSVPKKRGRKAQTILRNLALEENPELGMMLQEE